ncbi:MAG TPA: alpha/beta hydrolase [Thermomicrobiaceae bacterium]|nr:alpha/beta hydrolase [Thermomicrobiaceae bacterium]
MPIVQANGIRMYYELHGEGPPLVWINGLGADITESAPITRRLARRFRVLAFDNRGAGRSDKPDQPFTVEVMADDTAALMRTVGLQHANVAGISLGGRVALALALRHPELVRRLALISTAARSPKRWRSARLLNILAYLPIFRGQYAPPQYALVRQREASLSFDCSRQLSQIHVPTLIVHGKKDHLIPYALAKELHAGIYGSSMITANGGHLFLFMRGREGYIDAIAAFLST